MKELAWRQEEKDLLSDGIPLELCDKNMRGLESERNKMTDFVYNARVSYY